MRQTLTPRAEADIEEIWLYTLANWDADQADLYVDGLLARLEEMLVNPVVWRGRSDLLPGLMMTTYQRHFIFFYQHNDEVFVLRILHDQMNLIAQLSETEE